MPPYGDYNIALLHGVKKRGWRIKEITYTPEQREAGTGYARVLRHSLLYAWRI